MESPSEQSANKRLLTIERMWRINRSRVLNAGNSYRSLTNSSMATGKIERGLTTKLNQRTLRGLAVALGVSQEFLEAVIRGQEVQLAQSVKFCPHCWNPGDAPDPMWQNIQARFCYLCGTQLRASCANCGELLVSTRHRFCPICGHPYKKSIPTAKT